MKNLIFFLCACVCVCECGVGWVGAKPVIEHVITEWENYLDIHICSWLEDDSSLLGLVCLLIMTTVWCWHSNFQVG